MIQAQTLRDALERRYACKAFDTQRKIGAEDWQALKDCLRLAPSYYGLQPWRFIVVENPAIRQALCDASWQQKQVSSADKFVVITVLRQISAAEIEKHGQELKRVRGITDEQMQKRVTGMKNDLLKKTQPYLESWAGRQSFIGLGFAMLGASLLGIDSCPMGGIEADKYDQVLGLENGPWTTLGALALGYRTEGDANAKLPRVRFAENDVFQTI